MDDDTYKMHVWAIQEQYPQGFDMVVALAGPVPLPPPGIPDDEIEGNLADFRRAAELLQKRMEAKLS